MKVLLDALYFEFEGGGGVGRIFREALPRALDLAPELSVSALTTGHLRGALPAHARIGARPISALAHWAKALSPGHLPWGRVPWAVRSRALGAAVRGEGRALWHSTYYTLPKGWKGPSLVILYDAIHERYPELFPNDRRVPALKRAAVLAADHVACISESVRRDAAELYGLPDTRTSVLHLAGGLSAAPRAAAPDGGRPYLLYVGHRFAYKNFDRLLEALASWKHRGEFDLVCAGGAPFDASELARIDALGLSGRVRHVGRLDDGALAPLYAGAACLVYPSLYEGFGLPVLEAYAAGAPVALSRRSSLPEVGGEAGFYFDPEDAGAIAVSLSEAVGMDSAARAARAERARAHAARFSWDRTAEGLVSLYRSLA